MVEFPKHGRSWLRISGWLGLLTLLAACRTATNPGPDPNQPNWLPAPLNVVAPRAAEAQRMAVGLSDAGFRIQIHTQPQPEPGWWWLSRGSLPSANLTALLNQGAKVLLDGNSLAAQNLLRLQASPASVNQVSMLGATVRWDTAVPGNRPLLSGKVYAQTAEGYPALLGTDKLLWSLAPLDGGAGLLRLPYLPQALYELGLRPMAERHEIDFYFDPDTQDITLPALIEGWRKAGVRRVFVSAWKFDRLKGWTYNYSTLIAAAHKQGIRVYAWVALPHVSFSFWQQYPQCREETSSGDPAKIFWREHVALGVPACLDAAWNEIKTLIEAHPFDGVNLAELYFESPSHGPESPANYTPFHSEVRARFKAQAGFDPIELVQTQSANFWKNNPEALSKWETFRINLIAELHREILLRLSKLKAGKHLLVTLIDDRYPNPGLSPGVPQLSRNIGISTRQIISLNQTLSFEVQVEDPYILWSEPADRYRTIADQYTDVPLEHLSLDINVVERGITNPLYSTTTRVQGLELYQSIASAGAKGPALALYSSATLTAADYGWVKYALAARSTEANEAKGIITTKSPKAFLLHLNRPFARVFLDGKPWGGRTEQSVWVPAGEHKLWLEAGPAQSGTLQDTTCPDFSLSGPDPFSQTFTAKTTVPCAALVGGSWKLINP